MGAVGGVGGVDEVAIGGHDPVLHEVAALVEDRPHGRRGIGPLRRCPTDEPEVVQHRRAEGGVEEVVVKRVLLREGSEREVRGVVVAHRQRTALSVGDEPVHAAAVDLGLFLIEAGPRVADVVGGRHVRRQVEGGVGEAGREACVGRRRGAGRLLRLRGGGRLGKLRVGDTVAVDLDSGGVGNPVSARELPVEAVEAPVLHVDDDDVLDLIEPDSGRLEAGGRRVGDRADDDDDGKHTGDQRLPASASGQASQPCHESPR